MRSRMALDHARALAKGSRSRGAARWDSRATRVLRTEENDGACRAVLRDARAADRGRTDAFAFFTGAETSAPEPLTGARKISVTQS